ncbi:MAG: histidine kinase dimerization/phosphoacceptor domain -containing protein [Cyanobacteria bacterium P01_A01_bin.105]
MQMSSMQIAQTRQTFTERYQKSLKHFLEGPHLASSNPVSLDLIEQLNQQAQYQCLLPSDWLAAHQQAVAQLLPSSNRVGPALNFLQQCLRHWEVRAQLGPQANDSAAHQQLHDLHHRLRQETLYRERVEAVLQQREARLFTLANNMPGMLFQCIQQTDAQLMMTHISTRCRSILEMEPGEIYSFDTVLCRIPATDRFQLQGAMSHSARTLSSLNWEGTFITPSGIHKWLQIAAQPSHTPEGETLWDGVLFDSTPRRQAEISRDLQVQQFQNLVLNVPGVIFRCAIQPDWPIEFISEEIAAITQYKVEAFRQHGRQQLSDITDPDDQLMLHTVLTQAFTEHRPYQVEYRILTAHGQRRWILERGRWGLDTQTQVCYLDGVITDITDFKRAEAKIKTSLAEKDVLLREVHHRVKNNLNVVHSMLEMHARQFKDPRLSESLLDSQRRLQVMALIHEQLYRSEQLSQIRFSDYVQTLVDHFFSMAETATRSVQIILDSDPVSVSLELAIPLGLIVNELLTNALKHAFPDDRPGRVTIGFKQYQQRICLSVCDDGIGLPDSFQTMRQSSLGLRLVSILVDQLDAHLSVVSTEGTQFCLTFRSDPPVSPQHSTEETL